MLLPIALQHHYLHYLLRRDATKLYLSIAIRNLALGLVFVFEPIYLFRYFEGNLSHLFLYYAVLFGAYGALAITGGMLMAKLGTRKSILASSVFYIGYYAALFFIEQHVVFLLAAAASGVTGMLLFWPAFHTDFTRFSARASNKGGEVGNANIAMLFPYIIAPFLGGWVVNLFGFPALFLLVMMLFFASSIPLFYSKEQHEVYADSFSRAWKRVFQKEYRSTNAAFVAEGVELAVHMYIWPLFMLVLAIGFSGMGGITSFALLAATVFMVYVGKLSNTAERPWLLNIGALWVAVAWMLKVFVRTPFDALLAQTFYRIARAGAAVPFQTFFYEKASSMQGEADEFLVYREMLVSLARFVFFGILAMVFALFPRAEIPMIFVATAAISLGFMFLGNPPKIRLRRA